MNQHDHDRPRHETAIEVDPTSRSCGSPASSTPRPRRCSGPTSTPSSSSSGSARAGSRCGSTTGTRRTGGAYRYVHAAATARSTRSTAASTRCAPTELIVQTFTYEGFPDGVALETLRFEDLGDGRTRLEATSLVDSFEARDSFVASGMESGLREGYQRLDELLAQ